jgi:hypothetical protein
LTGFICLKYSQLANPSANYYKYLLSTFHKRKPEVAEKNVGFVGTILYDVNLVLCCPYIEVALIIEVM